MQSTMRKIPPKAHTQPSRAEGQALLPTSQNLPISRARSNDPRCSTKPKTHPQLAISIPQPKEFVRSSHEPKLAGQLPKTYAAPPLPILKRSETQVLRDNLREFKNDQRNGPAGDRDVAIRAVKG